MSFIKKWLLKRHLSKINKKSPMEESLDDYIQEAMKRHSSALRTSEKLLKAKMLDKQTKDTLAKIQELDDDDDDDEEFEEEEDFGDKIFKDLVGNFINGVTKKPDATQTEQIIKSLTPEQKEMASKFLGFDLK